MIWRILYSFVAIGTTKQNKKYTERFQTRTKDINQQSMVKNDQLIGTTIKLYAVAEILHNLFQVHIYIYSLAIIWNS